MLSLCHTRTHTCSVVSNTFKMNVAFIVALCLACAVAKPTLETCKCWEDFTAVTSSDGEVSCHGNRLFAIKPCNLPKAPKCVCEQDKPTGILSDQEGTWCSISEKGNIVKKWACENVDAWAAYRVEHEKYAQQRDADN